MRKFQPSDHSPFHPPGVSTGDVQIRLEGLRAGAVGGAFAINR